MKKRFGTLALALILVCSLAVPAGAANTEQTPEELYQEYLNVAAAINEEYGTEVYIIPLEEMDRSNMPTVAEVEANVRDLANLQKHFAEAEVTAESVEGMGVSPLSAMGDHPIATLVVGKVDGLTFRFMVSVTLTISTPAGTPSYYIQLAKNYDVAKYTVPSGYTATAVSAATLVKSSNECTIKRTFNIKKDSAYTSVHPQATFTVNKDTGKISSYNHSI